jgi:membrane protein CcdC involved in cytochrome C biogenesis
LPLASTNAQPVGTTDEVPEFARLLKSWVYGVLNNVILTWAFTINPEKTAIKRTGNFLFIVMKKLITDKITTVSLSPG